ncbi:hypothetical protein Y032_0167g130 [Ancylostoma ceylanicum]|nr:hypothetical protein Y032_0167g130 [Ancylostoma ceylanicum]
MSLLNDLIMLRSYSTFQTIILLITLGGQIVAFMTYALFFITMTQSGTSSERIFFYGVSLYLTAQLCLCIERAIAVYYERTYESYVSARITCFILVIVVLLAALCGTLITSFPNAQNWPVLIFFCICASMCGMITITLRFQKYLCPMKSSASLQQKFQHKENKETMLIYASVSFNEILCSATMIVLFILLQTSNGKFELNASNIYADIIDFVRTCKPPGHTYDGPYVDAPGGYYIEIWDHLVLLLSVAVVRLREPFVA